ncbi:PREDICTED: testicular haploid expressed gene protein-like, partial [Tinamus guttatus]
CVGSARGRLEFLEIGGGESLRSYWSVYLPKVPLLVYVVDAADHARLPLAKQLLHQLLQEDSSLPVVVLANKQVQAPPFESWPLGPFQRLRELAEPKKVFCANDPGLRWGNQEPIWSLSPAALAARPSPRTVALAQPKRDFDGRPQRRGMQGLLDKVAEGRQSPKVSQAAQQAVASPRVLELAAARSLLPDYMPLRDAEWPVCKAATHAVPSPRLVELAQPRKRLSMDLTQFNPEAFVVKESAMKAVCSARLQDLARPVKH